MDLSLQLNQKQVLSPQMQQSVEILQMNILALSEYAKEVAEENPLLEWNEEEFNEKKDNQLLQKLEYFAESDEQNRGFYHIEQEESTRDTVGRNDMESLKEYLLFQIHVLKVGEKERSALCYLAESVEESGYLSEDIVDSIQKRLHFSKEDAVEILSVFQALDPVGVGARNLKECLLIQLKEKMASALAIELADKYLEELAKNHIQQIAKKLKVSLEEIIGALQEIRGCQPKPGSGFVGEGVVEYVVPDILVEKQNGELTVLLNNSTIPHLHVNTAYAKMLKSGVEKETEQYIAEKLKQAEWVVVQCIQRRESTLQRIAECIVGKQKAFFMEKDSQLLPLRMSDVAEFLEIHESTVSRGVKDKYLQCEKGVFPLHIFFSKAMHTVRDTEVSVDFIHKRMKELVDGENKKKPMSDRELTEKLVEEGIQISRRTVAKYRESLGIPGASGRKMF